MARKSIGALIQLLRSREKKARAQRAAVQPSENILLISGFDEGNRLPTHSLQGAEIEGVQYIWEKEKAKRGKASICLHETAHRYFPIAQWYQETARRDDKQAPRLSAQVKAGGLTKATIDVVFLDEKGEWIEHRWAAYRGAKDAKDPPVSHDWKE